MSRPIPLVLASSAAALLLVAGCSTTKTIDADELSNFIEDDLLADYDVTVTDAQCPEIEDPKEGETFDCTAMVDGQLAHLTVEVTDADEGNVTVTSTDAILDITKLEQTVTSGVIDQTGVMVSSTDCSEQDWLVQAPGSTFECTVTGDDGSTVTAQVTVKDAAGNVSWELVS